MMKYEEEGQFQSSQFVDNFRITKIDKLSYCQIVKYKENKTNNCCIIYKRPPPMLLKRSPFIITTFVVVRSLGLWRLTKKKNFLWLFFNFLNYLDMSCGQFLSQQVHSHIPSKAYFPFGVHVKTHTMHRNKMLEIQFILIAKVLYIR